MPTNDIGIGMSAPSFTREAAVRLAAELEDTVGLLEASYFVGQVGDDLGISIGRNYEENVGPLPAEPNALAQFLVDLGGNIGADFSIETVTEEKVVLLNDACPFDGQVEGHPSLCMTTTNILGRIVSQARGYANVAIKEAFATGHNRCRMQLCLSQEQSSDGFEFFR